MNVINLPPGIDRVEQAGLYPHQADGVSFLISKKRAILADDMGLGKTRQAIVAAEVVVPDGPVLVVCPASLKLNWRREIKAVYPDIAVEVVGFDKASDHSPRWIIINYDLLARYSERLNGINWSCIILDEAHFIKNASKRTTHCLKLLGVQDAAKAPLVGPDYVFLLTGTPMTNRPKDLFNLLRCVGHPSSRSFLSFAKRYCDAYRNDWGWVTSGASNLGELNLLMKEIMLRRMKDEVLDLPPKIRSWVPVDISDSKSTLNAIRSFLNWYVDTDPAKPNDTEFLARLTKVRTALHKAKQKAAADRIKDVVHQGDKVVLFTCFSEGIERHKKQLGNKAVTITGSQTSEQRMQAVDAFQNNPDVRVCLCNIIAGGVGITLTAGTHVLFQDLDWVPANHAQAEDRCYRLGQISKVTVEYLYAAGTLDSYIAELLEAKINLIKAVEAEDLPDGSILKEVEARLRSLAPALMEEARLAAKSTDSENRIEQLSRLYPRVQTV
ncbi:DEAD/DEAH box helicase, partial [Rhodobacteraceae bacterium]|nr:DEAD/DEAH box helicase [Paracoccaceae bacterium]